MARHTRRVILKGGALAAAAISAGPSWAQEFAPRQMRIVVSAAAGGATDAIARLIGGKIAPALKTTLLVENHTGGHFGKVFKETVSSPPDGTTIFMAPTSAVVAQLLHPEVGYDMRRDMTPVTQVATGPLVLVARKGIPIKNISDLIEFSKKNPNKVTFGSGGGTGSSFYLALQLLRLNTGITFTHVPYRGAGPALNDLLGGHIDMMFDAMPIMAPQIKSDKVTPVAVTSLQRIAALPDVPTVVEQGIAGYEVAGWFGLLAPGNTPLPIRQRIRDEVAKALKEPDVVTWLTNQGMTPVGSQPEEWFDYLKGEIARWAKVVKDADIKPE